MSYKTIFLLAIALFRPLIHLNREFRLALLCVVAIPRTADAARSRPEGGTMATVKRKPRTAQAEEASVSAEELLKFYRDMLLIRRFEEKAAHMYGMGLIGGFFHPHIWPTSVLPRLPVPPA